VPSTLRGSSKKFHRSGVFLELLLHLAVGQVLAVTREQYVVTVEEEGAEHAAQLLPLLRCPTFAHLPAWQWSSLLASWSPSMSSSPFNWLLLFRCPLSGSHPPRTAERSPCTTSAIQALYGVQSRAGSFYRPSEAPGDRCP